MSVEIHHDHLLPDAPDEEWITLLGRMGCVAVAKDKNIRYRAAKLASIRRHSARVIVVRAKNATDLHIADLLAGAGGLPASLRGRRRRSWRAYIAQVR